MNEKPWIPHYTYPENDELRYNAGRWYEWLGGAQFRQRRGVNDCEKRRWVHRMMPRSHNWRAQSIGCAVIRANMRLNLSWFRRQFSLILRPRKLHLRAGKSAARFHSSALFVYKRRLLCSTQRVEVEVCIVLGERAQVGFHCCRINANVCTNVPTRQKGETLDLEIFVVDKICFRNDPTLFVYKVLVMSVHLYGNSVTGFRVFLQEIFVGIQSCVMLRS